MFPSWFFPRALTVTAIKVAVGKIRATLTTRRILPTGAKIFSLVHLDDVESIKELLKSGQASPNDAAIDGGTILRVCIKGFPRTKLNKL